MAKFQITVVESERGWGQKYTKEYFHSYEAAKEAIKKINSKNVAGPAPDWYMQAEETIVAVDDED
jgi:hypothetical protein